MNEDQPELPNPELDEEVIDLDPRIPLNYPPPCEKRGHFGNRHINWDHRNLCDSDFADKYRPRAAEMLERLEKEPVFFPDKEALSERFKALI